MNKVDFVTADVKNTAFTVNSSQVELGNAFSKFLNLSNHKFTENVKIFLAILNSFNIIIIFKQKMQPFNDADLMRRSHVESDLIPLSLDANTNIVERYSQALNSGMDNVNIAQYLNQANDDDDRLSVSDAGDQRSYSIYSENSVLPGKNNKLPYIIGTRAFLEDDFIGIYESPEQPLKPEILSFQEISLPESNIKVENDYIPKIEPPPPIPILNQNPQSEVSQQNNNNVPNPPPLLNNGILVNQSAPPPPNLLLPGLKIGPPSLNQNQQANIPPPLNQQGGSKILVPPPLSLLLQNQGKPAIKFQNQNEVQQNQNNMQQFPNQMGMQPFPNQGMPIQNQGMNMNNNMMGQQSNMSGQPMNFNNNNNNNNNNMNMNMISAQMNQNFVGNQTQSVYAHHLSDSQIPQIDLSNPMIQNQNYYSIPQNSQPSQNYQSQTQNDQNYQNDQNTNQNNQNNFSQQIPPNNTNVIVNKKAPPPPNLKALLEHEKSI